VLEYWNFFSIHYSSTPALQGSYETVIQNLNNLMLIYKKPMSILDKSDRRYFKIELNFKGIKKA
jgi:hypothetical protein